MLLPLLGLCSSAACPCTIADLDVSCDGKGLSTFPPCIPSDVRSINFSNNWLELQPGSEILRPFHSLTKLDLSYNNLRFIPETFLHFSPKLEELYLDLNKLKTLHPRTFANSSQLRRLSLLENPWLCDCQMKESLDRLPRNCEVVDAWRTFCDKSLFNFYYNIGGIRRSRKC